MCAKGGEIVFKNKEKREKWNGNTERQRKKWENQKKVKKNKKS